MALSQLRMPRLAGSLCGLSLETGAKVAAFYQMFTFNCKEGTIFLLGFTPHFLTNEEVNFGVLFLLDTIYTLDRVKKGKPPKHHTEDGGFQSVFFRREAILASFVNVVLSSIALLHGIKKKEAKWMEPFLWTKGVVFAVFFMEFSNALCLRVVGFRSKELYIHLGITCVEVYMYMLVYNLYRDFKEKFGGTVV